MSDGDGNLKLPTPLFLPALFFAAGCAPWVPLLGWEWILGLGLGVLVVWLLVRGERGRQVVFYGVLFFVAQGYRWVDGWEPRGEALVNLSDGKFEGDSEWVVRLISELQMSRASYQRGDWRNRGGCFGFAEVVYWRAPGETVDRRVVGRVFVKIRNAVHGSYGYGDVLRVSGGLVKPSGAKIPGKMGWGVFLWAMRTDYILEVDGENLEVVGRGDGGWWMALGYKIRAWANERVGVGLEDDAVTRAVLAGMLFGYTEGIPEDLDELFRITGTYHIFAISGQNVGILLWMGLMIMAGLGMDWYRFGWLLLPFLVLYAFVSGLQPSVVRAVTMVGVVMVGRLCYRPVNWLNLWGCALLGLLLVEPRYLWWPGFVLSFSVVLGLIVLSGPILEWLMRPFEWMVFVPGEVEVGWGRKLGYGAVRFVMSVVAMSVAAWCGSVVWMFVYFQYVSVVSVVANMVVVPLAAVIVMVGMLSLFFAPWWVWVTASLNNFNWILVQLILVAVKSLGGVPWAALYLPHPSVWGEVREPVFTVVGGRGGVSALVRYGGRAWLIDPGSEGDVRYRLRPLLRYYGVRRLDGVFITQMSSRVAGSSGFVARYGRVGEWVLPPQLSRSRGLKEWLKPISRRGQRQRVVWAGEGLEMRGDLVCRVLWPPDEEYQTTYLQDKGLVLLFEYGGRSVLWAGQISGEVERCLMELYPGLRVDVLIQGYHPYYPSLGRGWVEALRPRHFIYWDQSWLFPRRVPWFADGRGVGRPWALRDEALVMRMGMDGVDVELWRDRGSMGMESDLGEDGDGVDVDAEGE